jgi:3,4-dihydroxy 2-butanone 4-phosphate synthase/GTP cyclohydrolase II
MSMNRLQPADKHPNGDLATWLAGGGAVIAVDTFGDEALIVFAAALATTELMAFAVRHGTGYLRVAILPDRADQLGLPPMHCTFRQSSGFTASVDARHGVGTGISAHDRAHTARLIATPSARPGDFTRPGHLLPVVVGPRDGDRESTLGRQALTLIQSTGLPAAAVYSEIVSVKDPTAIMAAGEAEWFARSVGVPSTRMPNAATAKLGIDEWIYHDERSHAR